MATENKFIDREKRFEVNDLVGFDAIVQRAGEDQSPFYANLIDFSRTGGKFELPFCARFDEQLKIQFDFKESELKYFGSCRVRHMRNVGENRWQVGCSLDPPLPEEVIAHLAKQTNQERRHHPRFDIFGEGQLRRQGTQDTCDAVIRNLSRGGFCLIVPNEHSIGEKVDFELDQLFNSNSEDNSEPEKLNIGARIRWQTRTTEGYMLGCSFVDAKAYSKLVDCLTWEVPEKNDRTSWLVLAAAILALITPIVYSKIFDGSSPNSANRVIVSKSTQTGPTKTEPVISEFEPKSIATIDDEPGQDFDQDSNTPTDNELVEVGDDAIAKTDETENESPLPETKQAPTPPTIPPVDVLAADQLKTAGSPEFETVDPALKSSRRSTSGKKLVSNERVPTDQLNREINGVPLSLVHSQTVLEKPSSKSKDKGSSRRVRTRRPIIIESEEIPAKHR